MRRTITLSKRIGQTPLEALEEWKLAHPRYQDIPATYAGRLDPMASGKLLVLLGDECKKKELYTKLDKVYEVEVLLDVGSDTGDILGIVSSTQEVSNPSKNEVSEALHKEIGTHTLPYPAFSSKTVAGKPLFLYALEGTLDTIAIPTHEETIYNIKHISTSSVPYMVLKERVTSLLKLAPTSDEPSKALGADFRIQGVRASWDTVIDAPDRTYTILQLKVSCGSGAYMRTLSGRIGESLGTRALALSIHRTKIGKRIGCGRKMRLPY